MNDINIGLEGVVVGATAVSDVDGAAGRLSYRGIDIETLVQRPYLHVAWLLLYGAPPSPRQEQTLAHFLLEHRALARHERELLLALPADSHPMRVLQGLVPLLDFSPRADFALPGGEDARRGLVVAARLPTLLATWLRKRAGLDWQASCNRLDPLQAFLADLGGAATGANALAALQAAQILQMEHSYNAGTFAGRVVLSSQAPVESSIAASIGTLFGKLHGGADQTALEFALAVGSPDAADAAVVKVLEAGGRIMGIGHREYQVTDPRARLLRPLAERLCADNADHRRLFETLVAIEESCRRRLEKPGKTLRANVEFYKGAVFHALGLPSDSFTAMFALARVWGYIAHALEFRPQSRLIRPRALYQAPGSTDARQYQEA
ncbi:MAG: citrate/2-methylcitrate synthase [Halieaceae bacterium]|jgi:citrate synthase|nr:citrate/2-methylcitrate synthase [Halieaceae bacterium]